MAVVYRSPVECTRNRVAGLGRMDRVPLPLAEAGRPGIETPPILICEPITAKSQTGCLADTNTLTQRQRSQIEQPPVAEWRASKLPPHLKCVSGILLFGDIETLLNACLLFPGFSMCAETNSMDGQSQTENTRTPACVKRVLQTL
jgi:hypothetical protein